MAMTSGEYTLTKSNGADFEEKIILAQSDKVLGFNSTLDPLMVSALKNPYALTFAATGGIAPGTYDGSAAVTVDYHSLGAESVANKVTTLTGADDTHYPSAKLVSDQLATKAPSSGSGSYIQNLASGTQTGARISIDGDITAQSYNTAGLWNGFNFGTGVSKRWSLFHGTTEATANVGSDFILYGYDNTGTWLNNPLTIKRSTGAATFSSIVAATQFNASTSMSINGNPINSLATQATTGLTNNYLPKVSSGTLVNSLISDDGTNANVNGTNLHFLNSNTDSRNRNWGIKTFYSDFGLFEILSSTTQGGTINTQRFAISRDGNVSIPSGTLSAKTSLTLNGSTSGSAVISTDATGSVVDINKPITATSFNSTSGSIFGSIGDSDNTTTIGGYGVLSVGIRYGNYGNLVLNASTGYTTGAKRYLITNGYNATSFAIVQSNDALTTPTLGEGGVIANGTERYYITNDGNSHITGGLAVSGNITGALVNGMLGLADTNPLMDGTAAIGTSTKVARMDHVHASDTSRAADSGVVHLAGTETITGAKTFSVPVYTNISTASTGAYTYGVDLYTNQTTGLSTHKLYGLRNKTVYSGSANELSIYGLQNLTYGSSTGVVASLGGTMTFLFNDAGGEATSMWGNGTTVTNNGKFNKMSATSSTLINTSTDVLNNDAYMYVGTLTNSGKIDGFSAFQIDATNTGTINDLTGVQVDFYTAGGTTTNLIGLDLGKAHAWTGTPTNSYGIYIDASTNIGSVLNYAIYSISTAPSSFAGTITGSSIIKVGGAADEFLMANGMVDSTVYEPELYNPFTNGYVLSSTAAGVRSWIPNAGAVSSLTTTGTSGAATLTSGVLNIPTPPLSVSGTYTPTLTNTTNISSSSFAQSNYTRIGNIVHVNLDLSITPTADGDCVLTFTLPVNMGTGLGSSNTMGSAAGVQSGNYFSGLVYYSSTSTFVLKFTSTGSVITAYNVQFDYPV